MKMSNFEQASACSNLWYLISSCLNMTSNKSDFEHATKKKISIFKWNQSIDMPLTICHPELLTSDSEHIF